VTIDNNNEVMTRRKDNTLNEQKSNFQIEQPQALLPKKQIATPIVEEKANFKNNITELKRLQLIKLKEEHVGYIRLQDFTNAPSPELFEPENDDLEFLKSLYPKDFKPLSFIDPAVFNLGIYKDFIKVIEYIEATRDFSFKNLSMTNSKFTPETLSKLVDYWKSKTSRTKYPLKRKYWAANIKKEEFGKLNQLRIAYRDRDTEKRKNTRCLRKLSNAELLNQLKIIKETSKTIESLLNLELIREKLRYVSLKGQLEGNDTVKQFKDRELKDMDDEIKNGRLLYESYNPPISPPKSPSLVVPVLPVPDMIIPKIPVQPDNQIAYFISTLMIELGKYDFDINEIRADNIPHINNKIKALKQSHSYQGQVATQEKIICTRVNPVRPQPPSFEDYVPVKRFSYSCANDVFIDKVDLKKFQYELKEEKNNNLIPDFVLKRDLSRLCQDYSMFRVNAASGSNPDVYCDTGNYSTSNTNFENLKNWKYVKLLEDVPEFDDSAMEIQTMEMEVQPISLIAKAEQDISELNLGNNYKSWLNNKRVKTT